MDYNELLARYYEGLTTLDEERALREHFSSDDTPEGVMFGSFTASAAGTSGLDHVGSHPRRRTNTVHRTAAHRNRRTWYIVTAAAVTIAVMGTAILTRQHEGTTVYAYVNGKPVTDYETAYAYTQDALSLLSSNMDQSMQYLANFKK